MRADDVGVDGYPNGVGKCVEDAFNRNVFNRGVKKRPHQFSSYLRLTVCSIVPMFRTNESKGCHFPSHRAAIDLGPAQAMQFHISTPTQALSKDTNVSKLKGKVAVVTGASKGIGAAIAKSLAAAGASVEMAADRKSTRLNSSHT